METQELDTLEEITIATPRPSRNGDVDVQVATAKMYPRSIKAFKTRALSMATIDEETAASCFYSLPRSGKPISGPGVRLAEIVSSAWGNLRVDAKTTDEDNEFVYAESMTWDLETNVAVKVEVRRRITDKGGKRFGTDMIGVTANAAVSIALRNSVFRVVPFTYVKSIYDAAKECAIGTLQTLAERRVKAIQFFLKAGVPQERVLYRLGKKSIEDVDLGDLELLIGFATALKEGSASIDEMFPAAATPPDAGKQSFGFGKKNGDTPPETVAEATQTSGPTATTPGPEIAKQDAPAAEQKKTADNAQKASSKAAKEQELPWDKGN